MLNRPTAKIVNGKKIALKIFKNLKKRIKLLKGEDITPRLGVILVGKNKASEIYVKNKKEACKQLGVDFVLKKYSNKVSTEKLVNDIQEFQRYNKLSGLIVQLPLPKHINSRAVLQNINPKFDVDCLTDKNIGRLVNGKSVIQPPTPSAILEILKYYKINLNKKNIVLLGAGKLVGRPLVSMLLLQDIPVTVCNSRTENIPEITKKADILITGVGKPGLVVSNMVKRRAVVIDAGTSFVKDKIFGDVDFLKVKKKAKLITPTPGGVGPITVAKLMVNVVKCAEKNSSRL